MANNGHAGNHNWVRSALDRYESALTRYAHRIVGDVERARDVVQETFLRLCKQDRSEVDGHLPEWLFTVCRNKALDVQRKESRMATLAETDLQRSSCYETTPPEHVIEQRESAEQVLSLLSRLSENQQEVIRLKFQHGLSYREISQVTGLSISNVGFQIHKGLKTIRERMKSVN